MADEPQPTTPETPDAPEAKYTDKDLDRFKGTARKEGRHAALNELLQKSGAESADALLAAFEAQQTAEQQAQGDLDKANARADAAEQRAQQAETLAETRLVDAEMRSAMLEAGVPSDRVNSALRLAGRDAVKVGDDGSVEGVSGAVEALRTSDQYLFEAPRPTAQRTAPDVNTPAPETMDVAGMSGDEFAKLQEKVMRGETVMPATPEAAVGNLAQT